MVLVDYKYIFQKLKEKYDFVTITSLTRKKYYTSNKQESLLDLGGYKKLSSPRTISYFIHVNKFVDDHVKIKKLKSYNLWR